VGDKVKGAILRAISLTLLFCAFLSIYGSLLIGSNFVYCELYNADSMWIEPSVTMLNTASHSVGHQFNITLWLNLSAECKGWQFKLLYEKNYLNAIRTGYTAGNTSEFFENITTATVVPKFSSHNETHSYVLFGEAWIMGPTRSPGHGSLAWVEFNVTNAPSSGEFNSILDLSTFSPYQTYALDINAEKMALTLYNGLYTFTWVPPNIAIQDITPHRLTVSQNRTLNINVTISNVEYEVGQVNVTAYTNNTEIEKKAIFVPSGASITVLFIWNTTGFSIGNYTISAFAEPFIGEINTTDNYLVDGVVEVIQFIFDINGDGYVGIDDIVLVSEHFGTAPGHPRWDPRCDTTGDNYVGIDDIVQVAAHFGEGS
jgi:hypothetical protein